MKELGMRKVPPERPAMAGTSDRSSLYCVHTRDRVICVRVWCVCVCARARARVLVLGYNMIEMGAS